MSPEPDSYTHGMIDELDAKLREIDEQLAGYQAIVEARERLRAARAALTGESAHRRSGQRRMSQHDVADFLARRRDGCTVGELAEALGVSYGTVNAHLNRGRGQRFDRRDGRWFLREVDDTAPA